MKTAIVKYNAGNVISVVNALRRLGCEPVVTDDAQTLRSADKVIFPGVGEASTTMAYLREHRLDELIRSLRQPVLGICIGLQLMCRHSEEGDVDCLGIFDHEVRRFPQVSGMKIPQMGWNTLLQMQSPLFKGLPEEPYVYYVHSFYAETGADTVARSVYAAEYSAALQRDNFYAVQFHPEKSSRTGELILKNFLEL